MLLPFSIFIPGSTTADSCYKKKVPLCTWLTLITKEPCVHANRDADKKQQTCSRVIPQEGHNKPKVMNCIKVICFELPFQGHHAVFVPSGQRHSCMCVSASQGTSNYSSYYTSIQRNTDKRTCFETGNTLDFETRRHAAGTRCGETPSETQTGCQRETGFRQQDKDVQSRRRTGRQEGCLLSASLTTTAAM